MASAVFFLDLKGKASFPPPALYLKHCALTTHQTLLARNYRGDIPMSAVEKFPVLLSEAEEESSAVPPCFSDEGINVRFRARYSWSRQRTGCLLLFRLWLDSISTSGTTTSTCSLSQNATPTPQRSSCSSTRSLRYSLNISKNSRRNQYGIISSSYTSCWMR